VYTNVLCAHRKGVFPRDGPARKFSFVLVATG
jgi:hypothetical protein